MQSSAPSFTRRALLSAVAGISPTVLAACCLPQPQAAAAPSQECVTVIVNTAANRAALATQVRTARSRGAVVTAQWPEIGVFVVSLPRSKAATFVKRTRATRGVQSVGLSGVIVPEKSRPARQAVRTVPGREKVGQIATDARAVAANKYATGRGVTIGIADTGVWDEHSELAGRVDLVHSGSCTAGGTFRAGHGQWRPSSGDTWQFHGTGVASVAAGAADGHGMRGIAPRARIVAFRVVSDDANIYPESSICAVMRATALHLPVVNHSYGIDSALPLVNAVYHDPANPDDRAAIEAVTRAFTWSRAHGVLNIAGVGNGGEDQSDKPHIPLPASEDDTIPARVKALPGEIPGVLGVSQSNPDGTIGFESTFGMNVVDLSAVGEDIVAAKPGKLMGTSGTSFSSPAVAGAAALVRQLRPNARPVEIEKILYASSRRATCTGAGLTVTEMPCRSSRGVTNFFGHGHLDALKAVQFARASQK